MTESAESSEEVRSVELRTMEALEAIEFYLSELVYYSRAEHCMRDTPEKRQDYTRHLAEQLTDYNTFQVMRIKQAVDDEGSE